MTANRYEGSGLACLVGIASSEDNPHLCSPISLEYSVVRAFLCPCPPPGHVTQEDGEHLRAIGLGLSLAEHLQALTM